MGRKYSSSEHKVDGDAAENKFILAVQNAKNWQYIRTSKPVEDYFQHIDIFVEATYSDGTIKPFSIDVKSMKKIFFDGPRQDTWIWVEFKGVSGKPGWLYGKEDLIAFEVADGFLLVRRVDLLKLAEAEVDRKTTVYYPTLPDRKLFKRKGRDEETSLIKRQLIMDKLVHCIIRFA